MSYEPNPSSERAMPRRSLVFALLAFVLWGLWGVTSKLAINAVGPANIFGFYVISSLTVRLSYTIYRRVRPRGSGDARLAWTDWAFGVVALALNVCGVFAFIFALNVGSAALVGSIAGAYPLVTAILAVMLLHEKLNRFHMFAFALVMMGLIILGSAS